MKNTSKNSLNDNFCSYLEYHLSRALKNSDRTDIQRFWCDGVLCEPISEAKLSRVRRIEAKAWFGTDGQDEYTMAIKFGENALNQYIKGGDLVSTIPSENSMNWIDIDTDKKTIEIRLK